MLNHLKKYQKHNLQSVGGCQHFPVSLVCVFHIHVSNIFKTFHTCSDQTIYRRHSAPKCLLSTSLHSILPRRLHHHLDPLSSLFWHKVSVERWQTNHLNHCPNQRCFLQHLRLQENIKIGYQDSKSFTLSVPFRMTPSFLTVPTSLRTRRRPIIIGSTFKCKKTKSFARPKKGFYLLIRSPFEHTVCSLQTNIRCFQENMGKGKTRNIGGCQGCIATHTLPGETNINSEFFQV